MKVLAAMELLNSCMKEQWHYPLSLKSNKPNKIKKNGLIDIKIY
jgi:hypothetical protein